MKILKPDGSVEEGLPITDEQAEQKDRVEKLLHELICHNAYHYDWQGVPKCKKAVIAVAQGTPLLDALDALAKKPEPVPDIPAATIEAVEPITVTVQLPNPEEWKSETPAEADERLGKF
jgi:hypothetical protein